MHANNLGKKILLMAIHVVDEAYMKKLKLPVAAKIFYMLVSCLFFFKL